MGEASDTRLKDIIITPEDLHELELEQMNIVHNQSESLPTYLKELLKFVKQRKYTTYDIVVSRFKVGTRTARGWLDILLERGYVTKQYAMIKCSDSVRRKTAIFSSTNEKKQK